jgi:ABC-type uncharacterized transport system auxiliary subunit
MKFWRIYIVSGILLSLWGCVPILSKKKVIPLYPEISLPFAVIQAPSSHLTLQVYPTDTLPAYATHRIALSKTEPYIRYFSDHYWQEPPAQRINSLLIRALKISRHFDAVYSSPFKGTTDLALRTQLLNMHQSFETHKIYIIIDAALIDAKNGKIITAQRFSRTFPTQEDSAVGGVVAFNAAMQEILTELAVFVVHSV